MSKYAEAGVDFTKERDVVGVFKSLYKATRPFTEDLEKYGFSSPEDIGYFSDGIKLNTKKLAEAMGGEDIAIVLAMDGAGTKPRAHLSYLSSQRSRQDVDEKLDIANQAGLSRASVGIDAVGMVVNDLICGGARPAYLLDYVAWHNPNLDVAKDLASGLYEGARESGATVVGGENASLREMITGYDICAAGTGFILNSRYLRNSLTGERIEIGDSIIGVGSSGLHCNGISLGRKELIRMPVLEWFGKFYIDEVVPELGKTAAEEILTPTIIYKRPVLDGVLNDDQFDVKAVVNVTGEGILNLKRSLKGNVGAKIDTSRVDKLRPQPVFSLIQKQGRVSDKEMWEDFNMGIGMYIVVPREQASAIVNRLEKYEVFGEQIRAAELGIIQEHDDNEIVVITDDYTEVF